MNSRRWIVPLLLASVASGTGSVRACDEFAPADGYRFVLPEVGAFPGERIRYTISAWHEQSAQGFSLAASYPSDVLEIERLHAEGTILEAIESDFFESVVDPEAGIFVVGLLVDLAPPFEGGVLPNLNCPMPIVHLDLHVRRDFEADQAIRLEDGLSNPPIANTFVVDNRSIPVTELTSRAVRRARIVPAFLRGDATVDGATDVADVVRTLRSLYEDSRPPLFCLDAADINDDGFVDLSDPIYLLSFLYLGGPEPPPPGTYLSRHRREDPGPDLTADDLDCERPLRHVRYP